MKVGDLVKLLNDPEIHGNYSDIDSESVGLIVEVGEEWSKPLGPDRLGWRWVMWSGRCDWDCVYVEDLEAINESR